MCRSPHGAIAESPLIPTHLSVSSAAWTRTWGIHAVALLVTLGCGGSGNSSLPDATTDAATETGPQTDASIGDASDDAALDSGTMDGATEDGGSTMPDCVDLRATPVATSPAIPAMVDHGRRPDLFSRTLSPPYPTNAWWQNLVVGDGEQTINTLPYLVRAEGDRLSIAAQTIVPQPTYMYVFHRQDLSLGASASTALSSKLITDYDDLSVTVTWASSDGSASMQSPLVRGAPYISMLYRGVAPRIDTVHALLTVNGSSAESITGTRFVIELNSGQTWVVYASEPITLVRDGNSLTASEPYTGNLRAAFIQSAEQAPVLDAHASAIPTGGTVSLQVCGRDGRAQYDFERTGEGQLLMLGLYHHRDILTSPSRAEVRYPTLRGDMFGLLGDRWNWELPLSEAGFRAPRAIPEARVEAIRSALREEQGLINRATDTYFGGKQVAAMARLAIIADELGETEIASGIRRRLATALGPWLDGSMNRLRYDRTWGGIVAEGTERDPGAMFGQGYYNDHHFHYGYIIYAAAALAVGDTDWLTAHRDQVDNLVRDIANPTLRDEQFTPFRNMDWFVGHSWAAGLFEFGDSRNQESTSEAVNAWYALKLWGEATSRDWLADLGAFMTAVEIRSSQMYWQVRADTEIYAGTEFANNRVVGILWSNKVAYETFFGRNAEFMHGIQYLPFTPAAEELLDPIWIRDAYPVVSAALTRSTPAIGEGWRGFIYLAHAIIDREAAWDEVNTLTGFDDGNSRTNSLYWVATRPSP